MIFAAFILALLVCVSNIISPSTVIFTPGQSFIGSVAIMIASIWQIPLCLFLIFKIGLFMPLVVNTAFGIFLPGFLELPPYGGCVHIVGLQSWRNH